MRTLYYISYDISNPRRLARLHRNLKRHAMPVQYSVFLGELTPAGLSAVIELIERVIDPVSDDVRIYTLPRDGWARALGKALFPKGICYTGIPLAYLPPVAGCLGTASSDEPPGFGEADSGKCDRTLTTLPRHSRLSAKQKKDARAIQARMQTGDRAGFLVL